MPPKRNQPFPGDTHSRRDKGSETLGFCSAAPVASQKQPAAEANLEVERLQGVIAALGEGSPLCAPLQAAFRSARTKSNFRPVNERVEACKGFLERAKKRFVRTEGVIAKAQEQKLIFEAELREGEARLFQLQAESEAQPEGSSVTELQSRIDPGARRVAGKSSEDSASRFVDGRWISSHARGSTGFLGIRGKVGVLVAQGSARMVAFAQDIPLNGQAKSSQMSVLIDQADAKRRCIGNTDGWESGLRNSRCGLRGVRLGEASNPGPPGRRVRDSAEEILEHHFPHGSSGTWMNQVRCCRSHVAEREDRDCEEVEEWGLLPHPAVVQGREVDSADVVSAASFAVVHNFFDIQLWRKNFPRAVIPLLPQFQLVQGQFDGLFSSANLRMSATLCQSWI